MNSIGPHFYALSPQAQTARIEEFIRALRQAPSGPLCGVLLAKAVRRALASMGARGKLPKVASTREGLEVIADTYSVSFANTVITVTLKL